MTARMRSAGGRAHDVAPEEARRIAVRAQLLDGSATSVLDTVRRLGFLQLDPIATVAPPQHLVLYARLGASYDPQELDRLLWKERRLFEWNAFLWPREDLPLVLARQRRRRRTPHSYTRDFLAEHARLRRHVLRELERNGPLPSRELKVETPREAERHAWWGRGALRLMLDILEVRGEIAVAGRVGTHRSWDLAQRVYPPTEAPPWREAERMIEERRRRSLGVWLERGRLRAYDDVPREPVADRVTFLSPFDRLVHDRKRAEAIFDFHYRLEMYVPKAKRQYGYYVLPVLRGERVVARAEPVFDRKTRELRVHGVWWEDGVRPFSLRPALADLAQWLGGRLVGRLPSASRGKR